MRTGIGRSSRRTRVLAAAIIVAAMAWTGTAANAAWSTSTSATVDASVDTITGMIQVSPPVGHAVFAPAAGSSVVVPLVVQNTSETSTWTAMRLSVTVDRPLPFGVKIRVGSTCQSDADNGTAFSALPFQGDDTTAKLMFGESRDVCWTLTHQRPPGQTDDAVFTVNVTLSGVVRSWTTGGITVPMTFTIPADTAQKSVENGNQDAPADLEERPPRLAGGQGDEQTSPLELREEPASPGSPESEVSDEEN